MTTLSTFDPEAQMSNTTDELRQRAQDTTDEREARMLRRLANQLDAEATIRERAGN